MRRHVLAATALAVGMAACGGDAITIEGDCDYLFGAPDESTGLGADVCRPELRCDYRDPFAPPDYAEADIEALRSLELANPPDLLPDSPYEDASLVPADTGGVCAVTGTGGGGYRLDTFGTADEAAAAGATVTHSGACGACSSLQDLAVYLSIPNLGDPVRRCALIELGNNPAATLACITELGFTNACAQTWGFNSTNTRASCLVECLDALDEPNHLPNGSLNACLACDEVNSGPTFKAVAGRTRRRSGLSSAIARPCLDAQGAPAVYPVEHYYFVEAGNRRLHSTRATAR